MDAGTPRVRRRGLFFHVETPELDGIETESAEGMPARIARKPIQAMRASAAPAAQSKLNSTASRQQVRMRRSFRFASATGSRRPARSEPLIQLARGEARNATTSPTSSARPKRPNGSSRVTNSAMPVRIGLLPLVPRPARKQNRARRDAVDADVVLGQLLRHRLREADFGRFHGVVGHPAARFAPPDRRDHHDRPAAARAACAARRAATCEWPDTASGRTPPATRRRPCRRCRCPSPSRRC